jgi:F-box/WD-40 domain protein MET30
METLSIPDSFEVGEPPSYENCDAHHGDTDMSISISSTTKIAGQTVAPFLAKHIPIQYAPLGQPAGHPNRSQLEPSSKFCYRHRPDLKCRRTADEPSMENLQRVRTLYQCYSPLC